MNTKQNRIETTLNKADSEAYIQPTNFLNLFSTRKLNIQSFEANGG